MGMGRVSIPWRGFVVFRLDDPFNSVEMYDGFQSPGGDSLYSDVTRMRGTGFGTVSFNPLAGIRCIQTMYTTLYTSTEHFGFNPLAGIRCIQTVVINSSSQNASVCFNPLAGIRCIQTPQSVEGCQGWIRVSIPWRGFVVFRRETQSNRWGTKVTFQSPGGDSLYSDPTIPTKWRICSLQVSIPWRGFVVFRLITLRLIV